MMFAALAPYKLLIECLAFLALIVAIAVGVHKFLSYEQQIGYDKAVAVYTAQALKDAEAARAKEEALAKQMKEAQDAWAQREKELNTVIASANVAAGGLRNTVNNLVGSLPSATAEATRKAAVAFSTVFLDCQGKYLDMAKAADGHASDVRTLKDSWPK